jgi:hypothetical protein
MPLPAEHGSPVLIYDGVGLLQWACTCKEIAGKAQGPALTPFAAVAKWNVHADSLPAKHRNPSSPHVLVIQHPFVPWLGKIRACCDACDHELGDWPDDPTSIGRVFAAFSKHI